MLIQLKRGDAVDLPILESGEPAFTTDTNNLYIGTGGENVQITGDQTFTYTQSVPSIEWTVLLPDGFKKFPSVTITDSAGTQVHGGIRYIEETNEVILTFVAAFSGTAHFN